jgi:putative phosphoesterase
MPGAVAFIADIHGNAAALDAVLRDIRRRGITAIFNLGDSVYGPLEPGVTAQRLIQAKIPSLRGNQDRILLEPDPPDSHPTLLYTRSCLAPAHFDWLRHQPCTIEYNGFFLCHGTPSADDVYLMELTTRAEMEARVAGIAQRMIVCGHSHVPRLVELPGGKLVLNPGSVGLPAYSDDTPVAHRMEAGSTHARYAIVDGDRVDFVAVPYDWRAAAAKARENGREDWAVALETGFAV